MLAEKDDRLLVPMHPSELIRKSSGLTPVET